jgi:hypothetical protein
MHFLHHSTFLVWIFCGSPGTRYPASSDASTDSISRRYDQGLLFFGIRRLNYAVGPT